ncbi:MAG: sigma-54 dependent transcriptional regulator [Planctomycetota bacterium]|jgi:two-component system nitrogen regulation response regulator GlnG
MHKLLVVDDEPNIVFTIKETLGSDSTRIITAGNGREAIDLFRTLQPDVVLMDVRLPDMSGLDAFREMHRLDPRVPVILMTAFSRTDTAIEAMSRGAFEYLLKPVDLNSLRQLIARAMEVSHINQKPAVVDTHAIHEDNAADLIIGDSVAMQDVYKTIGRVASQDVTVLILGESGTGKELVARALYHYSKRSKQPFLAVNCAALTESLLESELFGHEKGAFTGADQRRIGKFEQVNGGTIFLDEIGDMSPSTQAKALRLLQQQQFERVGGNATIQTDVRIIAATNKDLEEMVADGTFRQDLYYRLNGFSIHLPPLRERVGDVRALANYFARVLSRELGRNLPTVAEEAIEVLEKHTWPGNVRELNSAIRFAIVNSTSDLITPNCLPLSCRTSPAASGDRLLNSASPGQPAGALPDVLQLTQSLLRDGSNDVYRSVIHSVENVMFDRVLEETRGNQQLAAERLGISRMTLRAKTRARLDESNRDT